MYNIMAMMEEIDRLFTKNIKKIQQTMNVMFATMPAILLLLPFLILRRLSPTNTQPPIPPVNPLKIFAHPWTMVSPKKLLVPVFFTITMDSSSPAMDIANANGNVIPTFSKVTFSNNFVMLMDGISTSIFCILGISMGIK